MALELGAFARARGGHRLFDRGGAVREHREPFGEHAGLHAGRLFERALRAVEVARAHERHDALLDRSRVVGVAAEEAPALEHDADRDHREPDEEPEHPLGAQ